MTCHTYVALLVVVFVVAAICCIPNFLLFKDYCERIAQLEGRLSEFFKLATDEGGLNWFEIEQSGKILSRHYRKFNDDKLNKMGDELWKWCLLSTIFVVTFLGAAIFVGETACN